MEALAATPGKVDVRVDRGYVDTVDLYRADYQEQLQSSTFSGSWASARERAIERFSEVGFPTLRMEEWRNTNVASIARTPYRAATEIGSGVRAEQIEDLLLAGCRHAVLVNGRFSSELSRLDGSQIEVSSLAVALAEGEAAMIAHLGRYASIESNPFVALNTALFRDGVLVRLVPGRIVQEPLQLLHLAVADPETARVTYPRTLIVAGEQSQGTIIESYATLGEGELFTCAVTEMVCEQSSVLRHYKYERESESTSHVATQRAELLRDCNLRSLSLTAGGALVRNDIHADLDGEGIDCTLNGLYVIAGRQLVDHHMRVEHKQPHCNSHEIFKGILDDQARAIFSGRIYVHKPAQKTDAVQTNRNLLLSDGALVHSNPQLEIFADDVKCTHGSTIGQLDPDALFYLRSRGIEESAARSLLIYAFAGELIDEIEVPSLRTEIEEFLYRRLPGGELLRQVG